MKKGISIALALMMLFTSISSVKAASPQRGLAQSSQEVKFTGTATYRMWNEDCLFWEVEIQEVISGPSISGSIDIVLETAWLDLCLWGYEDRNIEYGDTVEVFGLYESGGLIPEPSPRVTLCGSEGYYISRVKEDDTNFSPIDTLESDNFINKEGCPGPTTVTIYADVSDSLPLDWVRLYYFPAYAHSSTYRTMSHEWGDIYKATIGPFSGAGPVYYSIKARDNAGHECESSTYAVIVNDCDTPPHTWYLAEGYTGSGFGTYILIQNPNSITTTVDVTYMVQDGSNNSTLHTIPGNSRYTIAAQDADEVGLDKAFSTKLLSDQSTIVERAMYWPNGEGTVGGHNATGVTAPNDTWYLAEGYTGSGFETYVLIQNPNDADATIEVTYMLEGGGTVNKQHIVPANSRYTIVTGLEDEVGLDKAFSTKLVSDQPIIVERAMYWANGGHCSVGVAP